MGASVGDGWRSGRGARAGRGRGRFGQSVFASARVAVGRPHVHERGGPSESAPGRRALGRLLAEPLCRRPVGRGTDGSHEWCPDHDRRDHAGRIRVSGHDHANLDPAGDRPGESRQPSGAQYSSDRQAGTRCVDRDSSCGAPDDHVGVESQVSGDPHGPLPVRASDARGSVGIDPAGAGRAAGRHRLRAADRVRERREPDAGARRGANTRDGHSRCARRTAGTSVAADPSRERNPRDRRWRARPCACAASASGSC